MDIAKEESRLAEVARQLKLRVKKTTVYEKSTYRIWATNGPLPVSIPAGRNQWGGPVSDTVFDLTLEQLAAELDRREREERRRVEHEAELKANTTVSWL